jgi:hypothetical protein
MPGFDGFQLLSGRNGLCKVYINISDLDATLLSGKLTSLYADYFLPGGPAGAIGLSQDVGVLHEHAILEFDYRAGWELISFGAILDRKFDVLLEPFGGGSPIATFSILTAFAGTDTQGPNQDTGPLSASIDLSAYAGTNSRLTFKWTVPENYTGPANAQLDNVRLTQGSGVNVPGPLPILGIAAAFGFSRKLRKRIKLHRGTGAVSTSPGPDPIPGTFP